MSKRVVIVGSGGREHALVRLFLRCDSVAYVVCLPGNDGIAEDAECHPIQLSNIEASAEAILAQDPDLVIVGPEAPLVDGLANALVGKGCPVVGPSKAAAMVESSKSFAKDLMRRAGVPTPKHWVANHIDQAEQLIAELPLPIVVKANGLCAGKGVAICHTRQEAVDAARRSLVDRVFGDGGSRILFEEHVTGREVSAFALTDGERVVMLPSAEDHKALLDGDLGPNTGGMGAYSPSPIVTPDLEAFIKTRIMEPVVRELAAVGHVYRGILFAGLMVHPERGPLVLEFNCRFGDPEAEVILPRLMGDVYPWFEGAALGKLPMRSIEVSELAAVCVVMCAEGYPGTPTKGDMISGLDDAARLPDIRVSHAATVWAENGWKTNGGRILGVTGMAGSIATARYGAYDAVRKISWRGEHHRSDIAARKR